MRNQGLLSFLLLLLVIVIVWLGVRPAFQALGQEQQRLAEATAAKQEVQALQATVSKLAADYEAQLAKANTYLAAVPRVDDFSQANLIAEVQSIASLAGVVVDAIDINIDQTSAGGAVNLVPVKLSATGDYGGLKKLLNALESNLPLLSGKSFTLTAGGGQETSAYNLSAVLTAFTLK